MSTLDVLAMTEDEVDAIVTDAQAEADAAADAVRLAEMTLRGELPAGAAKVKADKITPARLAELRAAAEHAALLLVAAERRQAELREQRQSARHAEIVERIRAEAADDMHGTSELLAALDVYEAALKGLCEAFSAHNQRVARWSDLMSAAGIHQVHEERRGPDVLSHTMRGECVSVGKEVYRPMRVGPFVGATLYRVLSEYPRDFVTYYSNTELTALGDLTDSTSPDGRVDLRELIRRNS
ncbi:hypothetical protein [Actinosynnema sp. NPDC023587]|uniref:hypothetical protein n=1 Tax=Actinosynnema sp. NPDC023587 TaxID=3154695 RepID=UPI0034111394